MRNRKSRKPWYTRSWFFMIVFSVWLLLPFLIKLSNDLFFKSNDLQAFDSSSILGYLCAILGAFITIISTKLASYYSGKKQAAQQRNDSLPFISVTLLPEQISIRNANIPMECVKPGDVVIGTPYIDIDEYNKSTNKYFFSMGYDIACIDSLSREQLRKLGTFTIGSKGEPHHSAQLILIKLRNIGKQSALMFYPTFDVEPKAIRTKIIPTEFPVNSTFFVCIYLDRTIQISRINTLYLMYVDCLGNQYQQKYDIDIDEEYISISLNSPQKIVHII